MKHKPVRSTSMEMEAVLSFAHALFFVTTLLPPRRSNTTLVKTPSKFVVITTAGRKTVQSEVSDALSGSLMPANGVSETG